MNALFVCMHHSYSGYSFADKFERNVAKQTWDRVKVGSIPLSLEPSGSSLTRCVCVCVA